MRIDPTVTPSGFEVLFTRCDSSAIGVRTLLAPWGAIDADNVSGAKQAPLVAVLRTITNLGIVSSYLGGGVTCRHLHPLQTG